MSNNNDDDVDESAKRQAPLPQGSFLELGNGCTGDVRPHHISSEELAVLLSPPSQSALNTKIQHQSSLHHRRLQLDRAILFNHHDEESFRQAASRGDVDAALAYLKKGIDVNCCDDRKRTALHFASTRADPQMVQTLLSYRANPNVRDMNHNTPLHLAACTNHIDIVRLLLAAGTDVTAKDNKGFTPLSYAQSHLKYLSRQRASCDMPSVYAEKICKVAQMISEYLEKAGRAEEATQVYDVIQRLNTSLSFQEVDDVQRMLEGFTSLAISPTKSTQNMST